MRDDQLKEALRSLGIEQESVMLVSLLPLVQVAWADGQIQERERELILGIAEKYGLSGADESKVLRSWLEEEPSPFFHTTARRVLLHLTSRAELPGGLDREAVVGWCWAIAGAAGGIFGTRLMAISGDERDALDEIAAGLHVDEVPEGWGDLTLSD